MVFKNLHRLVYGSIYIKIETVLPELQVLQPIHDFLSLIFSISR
jgi:hypothetical protein